GLAGEGREFHLAVDSVGDVSRQRGLAGAGIAEQAENLRRAVLAGLGLEPVGNGFERGILVRAESGHAGLTGYERELRLGFHNLVIRVSQSSRLPRRGIAIRKVRWTWLARGVHSEKNKAGLASRSWERRHEIRHFLRAAIAAPLAGRRRAE